MDERPYNGKRKKKKKPKEKGQEQLGFDAFELAEAAITRAADHAERVIGRWKAMAHSYLLRYGEQTFLVDSLRLWAHANGLPHPPDPRAWGHIILAASRAGVISQVGFDYIRRPGSHCRPMPKWRKN